MKTNEGLKLGKYGRKLTTQKQQRLATRKLHPRSLARRVGRAMGAGKDWREAVAGLPKRGNKYLYPEKRRT